MKKKSIILIFIFLILNDAYNEGFDLWVQYVMYVVLYKNG